MGGLSRRLGTLGLLLGLLRVVGVGRGLGGVLALGVRPLLLGWGVAVRGLPLCLRGGGVGLVGWSLFWFVLGALLGLELGVVGLGGVLGAVLRRCLAGLGSAVLLLLRWRVLVGSRPLLGRRLLLLLLLLVLGVRLQQQRCDQAPPVEHAWQCRLEQPAGGLWWSLLQHHNRPMGAWSL